MREVETADAELQAGRPALFRNIWLHDVQVTEWNHEIDFIVNDFLLTEKFINRYTESELSDLLVLITMGKDDLRPLGERRCMIGWVGGRKFFLIIYNTEREKVLIRLKYNRE